MKPNEYQVFRDCIYDGIEYGWNRAHKHTDNPSPEFIRASIESAIMLQINEYFQFEGQE